MDAQADLVAGAQKMEQKITILALMTLVFKRAGDQRILTFEEIVEATVRDSFWAHVAPPHGAQASTQPARHTSWLSA
eukprot:COSAG01_NODE_4181_length_5263_cov_38.640008_3_plen_77_part_00